MRAAVLPLVVFLIGGCAAIPSLAVVGDAISNSFAVLQRQKAREAQEAQTAEIKALREEIARLRAPTYLCFHGVTPEGAHASLCGPEAPK